MNLTNNNEGGKMKKIEFEIDENKLVSNLKVSRNIGDDKEESISHQSLDKLENKVSDYGKRIKLGKGVDKVTTKNTKEGKVNYLTISSLLKYFDPLLPSDELLPSNILYPSGENFEIDDNIYNLELIVESRNPLTYKKRSRSYTFNLTAPLLATENKADTIEIDENGNTSLTKRVTVLNDEIVELEEETITILDDTEVTLYEGINKVYLKNNPNLKLEFEYEAELKGDSNELTQSSDVTQTKSFIETSVFEKVDVISKDSKIKQTTDDIDFVFNSNKINFNKEQSINFINTNKLKTSISPNKVEFYGNLKNDKFEIEDNILTTEISNINKVKLVDNTTDIKKDVFLYENNKGFTFKEKMYLDKDIAAPNIITNDLSGNNLQIKSLKIADNKLEIKTKNNAVYFIANLERNL